MAAAKEHRALSSERATHSRLRLRENTTDWGGGGAGRDGGHLRRPNLALNLGELIGEGNHEFAEALALQQETRDA